MSAFMPCTPNPTTGFFFYVLRSDVIELDIPVEDAAKLIMTRRHDPAGRQRRSAEEARARSPRPRAPRASCASGKPLSDFSFDNSDN